MTGTEDLWPIFSAHTSPYLWTSFFCFIRCTAAISILPVFGEFTVTARIKVATGLSFALITAPAAPLYTTPAAQTVIAESINGILLGIALRFFTAALHTAGMMAAQSASLGQMLGNSGPEPHSTISNLFSSAGLALLCGIGLHAKLAALFIYSFQIFPPGQLPLESFTAQWVSGHLSKIFSLAFSIAAPFLIASTLYNTLLGAANRAMPVLMVSMIGAPVLLAGVIALLMHALPAILSHWLQLLIVWLDSPFHQWNR